MYNEVNNMIYNIDDSGYYLVKNPSVLICTPDEDTVPKCEVGNSGWDLRVAEDVTDTNGVIAIPTHVKVSMPPDMEATIRPRSGLSLKNGLSYNIVNSPGTIDSSYRGEIKIITDFRNGKIPITKGLKIAQMVFSKIVTPYRFVYIGELTFTVLVDAELYRDFDKVFKSDRGEKGFGSSGNF